MRDEQIERLAEALHDAHEGPPSSHDCGEFCILGYHYPAELLLATPQFSSLIADAKAEALRAAANDWRVSMWPFGASFWLRWRATNIERGPLGSPWHRRKR